MADTKRVRKPWLKERACETCGKVENVRKDNEAKTPAINLRDKGSDNGN